MPLRNRPRLRRVATLVARGAPPAELLDAVAIEMRQLLDADSAGIWRYEANSTATMIANDPGDLAVGCG